MVQGRQYLIQDCLTGTILRQDIPFLKAIRPGQKLLMAMIFYSKPEMENICPRCKTITIAGSVDNVEWYEQQITRSTPTNLVAVPIQNVIWFTGG
jgi:hypothetical protein